MNDLPPTRRFTRAILLTVVLVAASCGSVRPTGSPAGTSEAIAPTAPAVKGEVPARHAFADLLTLAQAELLLVDADGITRPVAGPGAVVEAASAARGTIVARTAGSTFHIATMSGDAVDHLEWRTIEIDPTIARRPLSAFALAPDASRLAILAADVGSGEPFDVVLVDIATSAARVVPVGREPNGPPIWVSPASVVLEVIPGAAGGPFLQLDVNTGAVEDIAARGMGPTVAGDGSAVAVVPAGPEPVIRVLPTADWLAGVEIETGEPVGGPVNALHLALDSSGSRVVFDAADDDGSPVSLSVYARDDSGWILADVINGEPPRWFGWLR